MYIIIDEFNEAYKASEIDDNIKKYCDDGYCIIIDISDTNNPGSLYKGKIDYLQDYIYDD